MLSQAPVLRSSLMAVVLFEEAVENVLDMTWLKAASHEGQPFEDHSPAHGSGFTLSVLTPGTGSMALSHGTD